MSTYATVQQLARFLKIEGKVPSTTAISADRPDETIGTGDNSATKFYLDFSNIINSTYTIRYSAAEGTAGTTLTETTDYTLDKDSGTITLTSGGVTTVGTNNLYGSYSYCNISLSDTMLQEALDRAQSEIDNYTNTHFATATDTTPDYTQVTDEKHDGKGAYDRAYYTLKYPLPNVSTTVSGTAVTASDTTIFAASTTGFLSSGKIGIGSDKISYTGKTSTSFTGCTGVDSAHSTATDIRPYIIEISTTGGGSVAVWQVLTEGSEYDIDIETGRIHIYFYNWYVDQWSYQSPPRGLPNRFRQTYMYGHDTIPADITRLCLMMAAKDLMHTIVRNKHLMGSNDFTPEMIDIDEKWIKDTLDAYTSVQSVNI